MKPFQTIQLNVKVAEQTADEIKRLAISRHQTVAELLRHFIDEGLKIHSYEQNIDFIAGIIRQEFTSVYHIEDIRAAVNQTFEEHMPKINRNLLKSGKVSAAGYFLLIKVLMEMGGLDSLADFVRMAEQAGTLGTEYMKQSNSTLNEFLTDGETVCRLAHLQADN